MKKIEETKTAKSTAHKTIAKEVLTLPLTEAIEYIKKNTKVKFDPTIELHINLSIDIKKQDQNIRFTIVLPNGTGKTKKVAVLASKTIKNADLQFEEADIIKLEKGTLKPKVDFDVLITEPRFMPKLAKAARVLGPAGVMPNPKNQTVTEDVEKAVELVKKGKVELRTEQVAPIIHTIIGKKSFETAKLAENFEEIMGALKQNKPIKAAPDWIKNCFLSSTMGSSVRIVL